MTKEKTQTKAETQEQKTFVTTQMILAKKGIIDKEPETVYSDVFGGDFVIENNHPESFTRALADVENDMIYAYSRFIYENCPAFREKELLTEYEVDDPYMLVAKILKNNTYELLRIGDCIFRAYGVNDKVAQIKKK